MPTSRYISSASSICIAKPQEETLSTASAGAPFELPEQAFYDDLKQTSHFFSLRDHLRFVVKPELRKEYEGYIAERSQVAGYKALAPKDWQDTSDQTVANLYWYLKQAD